MKNIFRATNIAAIGIMSVAIICAANHQYQSAIITIGVGACAILFFMRADE